MRTLKHTWPGLIAILLLTTIFSGCKTDCIIEQNIVFYEPIYMDWEAVRNSIGSESPRPINNPGKIFVIGNLFFINEVNEGVHVIDNTDPANPQNIKFINIPGSLDIAASSGKLYSDNYSDLIVLDISDLDNVRETDRVSNVFLSNSSGFWFDYSVDRVIVGWEEVDETFEFDCGDDWILYDDVVTLESGGQPIAAGTANSDAVGKAGSMARFALYNTNMFALNEYEMHVFDIAGQLSLANSLELQWGVETIFPYGTHLFIGSVNGMHILNVTDPVNPEYVSTYQHITSCDPVVVSGDLAYVTLRSGTECQGFTNQLDIIDISDLSEPELLTSYEMYNPHGIGLSGGSTLFLCDGDEGLKVFNTDDVLDIQLLEHYMNIHAYDVIPYGNHLFMIGDDGFYQYDISDLDNIRLVSTIPVED